MKTKDTTYYIGDMAKFLGLSQRAIRYYEELGFIKPARTEGGFRVYSERDADTIRMVIRFKDLGMSLEDIRALTLPDGEALTGDVVRSLREALAARRKEFDRKIKKYEEGITQIDQVLKILSGCATCGRPSERGVCEECLKKRGGDIQPLMTPLSIREEGRR